MKPYTLGLYEKALPAELSWREKLEQAGKLGFDALEISIDETDARLARLDWPVSKRSELVSLMADTGVPIRTMCLSGHRKYPLGASDPAVRRRGMEIMEKAIGLADDLGIRISSRGTTSIMKNPPRIPAPGLSRTSLCRCAWPLRPA